MEISLQLQRDLETRIDGMLKLCDHGEELDLMKTFTNLCKMKHIGPKKENLVKLLGQLLSVTEHDYNRNFYNSLLSDIERNG